jgi:hypothetical protein
MRQIEEHANPAVNKVLVGNKCEMPADQREVTKERGQVSSATLLDPYRGPYVHINILY